ncbi:MAG: hypothetical protein AAGC55_09470, partial [Myxococcota bacterium]
QARPGQHSDHQDRVWPPPYAQGDTGRDHHPYGYATTLIGGPITTAQRGIYSAIGLNGMASSYANPAKNRIAGLLAMGIWPFYRKPSPSRTSLAPTPRWPPLYRSSSAYWGTRYEERSRF